MENHAPPDNKKGSWRLLFGLGKSAWCLAICQNNDQLVNKDNQELTIYCYVSILVSTTKQYLKEKDKSYSEYHFT